MNHRKGTKYLPGAVLAGMLGVVAFSNGCSVAAAAAAGCSGLDTANSEAQASVQAFANAADALNQAATDLQTQWMTICNNLNTAVGQPSGADAGTACNTLGMYIQTKQLTVSATFKEDCEADVSAEANCEATCAATAKCDVAASCMGGEVIVGCMGSCSGQCDVKQPAFMCTGVCKGECDLTVAAACTGQCSGTCSGMMSGSCSGNCTGSCDGKTGSTGKCAGVCKGTCDATASGSCSGTCQGSCSVAAGASCSGTCKGTCSYTPGSADCDGECHGTCKATTTPPTCTGTLDCNVNAQCTSNCQAQAQATVSCSQPEADIQITGDDNLFAAYQANATAIADAVNKTAAIAGKIQDLATTGVTSIQGVADVGAAGTACIAQEAQVATSASVSVQVSVSASATVTSG